MLGIIAGLGDERTVPIDPFACVGYLLAKEPASVGFRADAQDVCGRVEAIYHPARPAFGWRAILHIAVKNCRDPVGTETFRKPKYPRAVFFGIMAVAYEHPDGFLLAPAFLGGHYLNLPLYSLQ
jgi:hypothetical protein